MDPLKKEIWILEGMNFKLRQRHHQIRDLVKEFNQKGITKEMLSEEDVNILHYLSREFRIQEGLCRQQVFKIKLMSVLN